MSLLIVAYGQTEKQLAKLPQVECTTCTKDISPFYDLSAEVVRINTQFITKASWETGLGKTLAPGRVVVLHNGVSNHLAQGRIQLTGSISSTISLYCANMLRAPSPGPRSMVEVTSFWHWSTRSRRAGRKVSQLIRVTDLC